MPEIPSDKVVSISHTQHILASHGKIYMRRSRVSGVYFAFTKTRSIALVRNSRLNEKKNEVDKRMDLYLGLRFIFPKNFIRIWESYGTVQ